jgi:hypothetical protein
VHEPWQAVALAIALEERDLAGHFLEEEVEIAVSVGVHQLRTGSVESADEGHLEDAAGAVQHRKGRDRGVELEAARGGGRRRRRCSAAGEGGEQRERGRAERQEQGLSAAGETPRRAGVMPSPAA